MLEEKKITIKLGKKKERNLTPLNHIRKKKKKTFTTC